MAKVIFCKSDGKPVVFELTGDELSLGRHAHNAIVINSNHISSTHAKFKKHASGSYELIDLQSSNGTEVNGNLISSVVLRDGDTIMFGPLVARFERGETNGKAPIATPDDISRQRYQVEGSKPEGIVNRTNGAAVGKERQEAALNSASVDLAVAGKRYETLQLAVGKLDAQRAELEDRTGAADDYLRRTVAQISDQEAQLDQLREEAQILLAASKERAELEEKAKAIESRSMDLIDLESKFEQLAGRTKEEERVLVSKARERRELEDACTQLVESIQRKRDELDAIGRQSEERAGEREKADLELGRKRSDAVELETELKRLESEVERLSLDTKRREESSSILAHERSQLEERNAELRKECENLDGKRKEAEQSVAQADELDTAAASRAGARKAELEKQCANLAERVASLTERENESNALEKLISDRQRELERLATEKQQLEAGIQTLEQASHKLRGIREDLAIAEAERETLSNQIEQGKAELASVGEQLTKAEASCSEFLAESERLKGEALNQERELEVRRSEIKQAKDALAIHRENLESAESRSRSEAEEQAAKLAAARKALEEITADLGAKQQESVELAAHANQLEETIGQRLEEVKVVSARQTAADTALQSTEAAVDLRLHRVAELTQAIASLETVIAEKHAQVPGVDQAAKADQTMPAQPATEKTDAERQESRVSLEEELTRLGFNITHPKKPAS